ncbi:kinase [Paenibacillus alvei]|uniref:GHMP family kinase ATP-binding protein n=1 Tax=Paenibacillus alvei TaxID=44250 RepID=UPI003D29A43C
MMQHQMSIICTGSGKACGTFGELLQGVSVDGNDFLVTMPINRFSTATFTSYDQCSDIMVYPSSKHKSKQLADLILSHYRLPPGGMLEIESNIPVGKGLASSSADLVATIRAVSDCFQLRLDERQTEYFLRKIEPTDGVMYSGIVSFFHRHVQLHRFLGESPLLTVLGIDEGGELDTVEFNNKPKPFSNMECREYDDMLCRMTEAIRAKDVRTIGEISTRSAIMNQKLCEKKRLDDVLAICRQVDALGVIVAHSGTFIGILFTESDKRHFQQLHAARLSLLRLADEVHLFHAWNEDKKNGTDGRQFQNDEFPGRNGNGAVKTVGTATLLYGNDQ